MWHAWIQNKELHVVLIYMFPMKPSMVQKWRILTKIWGAQIFALVGSNRRKKVEFENQIEGKVLWNNLSPRRKYSDKK